MNCNSAYDRFQFRMLLYVKNMCKQKASTTGRNFSPPLLFLLFLILVTIPQWNPSLAVHCAQSFLLPQHSTSSFPHHSRSHYLGAPLFSCMSEWDSIYIDAKNIVENWSWQQNLVQNKTETVLQSNRVHPKNTATMCSLKVQYTLKIQ